MPTLHLTKIASVQCLALAAILLSGCRREEVRAYQAPKESTRAVEAAAAIPAAAPTVPGKPRVTWTVPAGWEELPGNAMRVGSFVVKGAGDSKAEVSVIPLPGSVGTELDNVNRWRGQVGLPEITADILKPENVELGAERGHLFEMAGKVEDKNVRVLAVNAMVAETSWFFKMTGDDALVAAQKDAFLTFLRSVRFGGSASATPAPAAAPAAAQLTLTQSAPGAPSEMSVPAGWKAIPAGPMLLAKYSIPDGAESSVSVLSGDAGGLLANVNRWRGQIGLEPVDAGGLSKITAALDVGVSKATLVDLSSADGKKRLMTFIVPRDGKSWFFKMTGDAAVVGREKETFTKFVQSFQFPNAQ